VSPSIKPKGKKKKKKRPIPKKREFDEDSGVSPDVSPDVRNPFSEPNSVQVIFENRPAG